MSLRTVSVGGLDVGPDHPLLFIAGPCVIESEKGVRRIARELAALAESCGVRLIFKASYDKANRSSLEGFRGPGLKEGLAILRGIRDEFSLPITSDVHQVSEVDAAADVLDLVQIPAFLCRQTDLLVRAAAVSKALNVKKGQFLSAEAMSQVVEKVSRSGGSQLLLTERGTFFGYGDLVVDMRSMPRMQSHGFPVIFDATHSVQKPGALGNRSGGERELAPVLASAAVAAGADGVFLEVHDDPDRGLSDGPNMLPLDWLPPLFERLTALRQIHRTTRCPEGS